MTAARIAAAAAAVVVSVLSVTGCRPVPSGSGPGDPHRAAVEQFQEPAPAQPDEWPDGASAVCDENGAIVDYSPRTSGGRRYAEKFCGTDYAGMLEEGLRQRGVTRFGG